MRLLASVLHRRRVILRRFLSTHRLSGRAL
jgi:hypothetical protein